jgi:two-component system sensor histidine kinase RegB
MPIHDLEQLRMPSRNVRIDTLVRLRWLSIIGQTLTVLFVQYGLEFAMPIWGCLAVIGLAAWLNIALSLRFRQAQRLEPARVAALLAFDIGELALLIFLTGGLENPFSFFLLAPVLISATALPPRLTVVLGAFAVITTTILAFYHYPLPWTPDEPLEFPTAYIAATWLSTVLAIFFIGIYAWQIAEESRQLVNALAAAELALAREQHVSQLDGLAAAAAHALGTPLSTISVIARELERMLPENSPHADDVRLLREQAQRCRDILGKLNELSSEGEPFDRMPISALLEEVAAPHRNFGIAVDVVLAPGEQPFGGRNPAILYGLGNLVENAVDFARARVEIRGEWSSDNVTVTISDDGPGFAPEVISRIGEPYVRSRRRRRRYASDDTGLGLGFFIAKTLLERSGAQLRFMNRRLPLQGAVVTVKWPREEFERAPRATDLEKDTLSA